MTVSTGAIVLGYGGSSHSKIALAWAEGLARQLGRPLVVIVSVLDVTDVGGLSDELAGAQVVRELEQSLAGSPARVTVRSVATAPGAALVRESEDAYVTVLGARTHGPLASMVRGSVSQHVTRHALGPVVVVRESHSPAARSVVIGANDSTSSRAALEFGFDYASQVGSAVEVVHAQDDDSTSAETAVREAVSVLTQKFPQVPVTTTIASGSASEKLADASRSAELVVVGSRGRSSLAGLLLGSVSQSLLEHAQCPVAIIH